MYFFYFFLMQENTSITSVDLADNLIEDSGAEALAAMLKVFFSFLFLFSCFSEHSAMFWLPPPSPVTRAVRKVLGMLLWTGQRDVAAG